MPPLSEDFLKQRFTQIKRETSRRLGGTADPNYPPHLSKADATRRLGGISLSTLNHWIRETGLQTTPSPWNQTKQLLSTPDVEALLDDPHRRRCAEKSARQLFAVFE